jgi:hypothetical protein
LQNHSKKKKKLSRLPKIEGFILAYRVPPLWPTYICERRTTFAKSIWDESEVLWRTCWEHIGNLKGTHWELKGNIVGTHWEPGNNETPPCPSQVKRKKTQGTLSACMAFPLAA